MAASKSTARTPFRTPRRTLQLLDGTDHARRRATEIRADQRVMAARIDLRLRRWTAKLVGDLPVEIAEAKRVLVLARNLAGYWLMGEEPKPVPASRTTEASREQVLRSYAARFVADLPSSSEAEVRRTFTLAGQLVDGWLMKGAAR